MSIIAIIKLELWKMAGILLGSASKVSEKEKDVATAWDYASARDTK